jgi:hypothetical protein
LAISPITSIRVSGFALYQSFTGAVNGLTSFGWNQTSLAAFNITNGGLLTTTLGVSANLSIEGSSYPVAARQLQLQPGETGSFNLPLPITMEDALTNPGVLQAALFTGLDVNLTMDVSLGLNPFLTASAASSQLSYLEPIISSIDVRPSATNPYNTTHVDIFLIYSFLDSSPISLNGTISVLLTDSPTEGKVVGAGTGPFVAKAGGLNQGTLDLYANASMLRPGVYYANLTVTASGATGSAVVPFNYGQGG